jgi:hypothetical protein
MEKKEHNFFPAFSVDVDSTDVQNSKEQGSLFRYVMLANILYFYNKTVEPKYVSCFFIDFVNINCKSNQN